MRKWLALRFQCLFLLLNIKNYVCLLIWRTWQYICLDRSGKFSFVSKLDWKYTTKQVHLEPRQTWCSGYQFYTFSSNKDSVKVLPWEYWRLAEAATRGFLKKKLFLIFRNIHKKTLLLESIKLQVAPNTSIFLWMLRDF